jgi:NAD(P)-dependent dehydrogenase (short-subunit alcohol dehydrogenase family)
MSQQSHLLASNVFTCKGLTAVVTGKHSLLSEYSRKELMAGGGTGIGLMQTLALAQNGAKVYITSRNADKLNHVAEQYKSSGDIVPVVGDITSKDGIAKIVEQIQKDSPNGINILYVVHLTFEV